jgi:hypothetical protein
MGLRAEIRDAIASGAKTLEYYGEHITVLGTVNKTCNRFYSELYAGRIPIMMPGNPFPILKDRHGTIP